jgi:hypothetical protein
MLGSPQQRHKIIRKRVALRRDKRVSVVTVGTAPTQNNETPPMRIYIFGKDGITLSRELPAAVSEGEIVVVSNEELHAARLSGKRLLALWNALPDVEKRRKVAAVAVANFAVAALSALSRSRSRRPGRRLLLQLLPAAGSGPSAPRESAARSRRQPHPTPAS